MRTAEEIRARQIGILEAGARRPAINGGRHDGVEIVMPNLLDDLRFIEGQDSRDGATRCIPNELKRRGLFCSTGVPGVLHRYIQDVDDFASGAGSDFAELAAHLGYLTLVRRRSPREWRRLRQGLRLAVRD